MTPLTLVAPAALDPGPAAARSLRSARTVHGWARAWARAARRLVPSDRGAPPCDPADRHWAVGTTLGHLVQDVR